MLSEAEALQTAERFLWDEVRPRAQKLDRDPETLRWALDGLCARGLMALRRPAAYGGPAVSEEGFRAFQELCARVSGCLAFLQTQHQSAASMIARSPNEALKAETLPRMHDGGRLVGIGFSQLRRPGPPLLRAERTSGGYALEGQVPWVTGYGYFSEFLVGATLPDGRALFALVPLESRSQGGEIGVSPPMRLAAMEAANTVSVEFRGWRVPEESVAFIQPADWIRNNDQINIALQGHFALGCAQAGLDILAEAAQKKGLAFIQEAHAALSDELARCKEETRSAQSDASEETTPRRLEVRAWAIDLAVRCAHAAVAASSGAANSLEHPAQRVYREALVFTVSAQTGAIMEATLRRLTRAGLNW